MTKKYYGINIETLITASDKLASDLDYLCSLVELPDKEFHLSCALTYSHAVVAVSSQLDYILEEISQNILSDDEEYVKISQEEIDRLNSYTENSEASLMALEEICGISLENN